MVKLSRRFKYAVIISAVIMSSILMYKLQWDSSLPAVDIEQDNLNGPKVSMDDPRLVQKVKSFLIKPVDYKLKSSIEYPYKLSNPEVKDPSMGQAERIRTLLRNKENGFFIEAGALDGETRSNSLYFERYLNWTGLLIEPDPLNFVELVKRNRRAWISPTCLSINSYPDVVLFEQNRNMGKIAVKSDKVKGNTVNVQCFPFYSYLLALNVTHIDYFSLDIEGLELDVLKTIPFKDVNIETLSVEFAHVPGGKDAVSEFMFSQGYIIDSEVTHPDWLANDFIFTKM
ncbi:protein Star-like isoform X2 [Rhodnius prolixus]|uniref:protein Star-like isoform X2 n=1 Tax=Rhodnius prolixus TaxID=13249 RepID=UPI003D18F19E